MTVTYFPRLSDSASLQIIDTMNETNDLTELSKMADTDHPFATYYSVAHQKVPKSVLLELRNDLVAVAKANGFPNEGGSKNRRMFDQLASPVLDGKAVNLIPSEAADREVWNFLTLILLPDLAKWRYPNPSKDPRYDRWLGEERNVFRKLWWRQVVLGSEINSELGEDEAVAIMERPNLAGHPPLARAMAKAILQVSEEQPEVPRSFLQRFCAVRVRARYPIINYSVLSESELDQMILTIYREGAESFKAK